MLFHLASLFHAIFGSEDMKTGYHAIYEENFYRAIDHAAECGFEFVQFDLGVPTFFIDNLSDTDLKEIRDYAKSKRVEITFHAPGDNVSLFCDYPLIRDGIMKQFKMIIKKANILEARHITIHAGDYPRFKKSGTEADDYTPACRDHYENILYDNLGDLILSSKKTFICLENNQFNPLVVSVAKKLIQDGFSLYFTMDLAKMYTAGNRINNDDFAFFKEFRNNVRELHIHDRNEAFGMHQIVGTGIVDFTAFNEFIQNEKVYLNFEVRPLESAVQAKKALFKLLSL